MKNGKIESFTDLKVWQEGHSLVIKIYNITKMFPKEETYFLVDQMRRAATSITANIAEEFGGKHIKKNCSFIICLKGLKNFIFNS